MNGNTFVAILGDREERLCGNFQYNERVCFDYYLSVTVVDKIREGQGKLGEIDRLDGCLF